VHRRLRTGQNYRADRPVIQQRRAVEAPHSPGITGMRVCTAPVTDLQELMCLFPSTMACPLSSKRAVPLYNQPVNASRRLSRHALICTSLARARHLLERLQDQDRSDKSNSCRLVGLSMAWLDLQDSYSPVGRRRVPAGTSKDLFM
jgi:hypothetical protein